MENYLDAGEVVMSITSATVVISTILKNNYKGKKFSVKTIACRYTSNGTNVGYSSCLSSPPSFCIKLACSMF